MTRIAMKRSMPTLGDRLRHAREAKGLTQFEVATEAGIRVENLNRIERGKSNAALVSLHKLAPVLGLKLEELVGLHASLAKTGMGASSKPGNVATAKPGKAVTEVRLKEKAKAAPGAGRKGTKR